jgi:hypothetical protein
MTTWAPTAQPWCASTKSTEVSPGALAGYWVTQCAPPSAVARTPLPPTAHPADAETNWTPFRPFFAGEERPLSLHVELAAGDGAAGALVLADVAAELPLALDAGLLELAGAALLDGLLAAGVEPVPVGVVLLPQPAASSTVAAEPATSARPGRLRR